MLSWLNENNGALMVVITVIYVVATIFICYFNGKSANAAQKQILEANRQQQQNAGIQLYEKRKQILKLFKEKDYNAIYWDIGILFNSDIENKFNLITTEEYSLKNLQSDITEYENCLKEISSKEQFENVYNEYEELLRNSEHYQAGEEELEKLYKFCDDFVFSFYDVEYEKVRLLNYRNIGCQCNDLIRKIDADRLALFFEIQKCIKESIS